MLSRLVGAAFLSAIALLGAAAVVTAQPGQPARAPLGAVTRGESTGATVVELSPDARKALDGTSGELRLDGVPLGTGRTLSLERFEVVTAQTQFVVARPGGWERIATPRIVFWRGRVEGEPGSSVFLAVGEGLTIGSIDLGGGERYGVTSRLDPARSLPAGQVAIYKEDDKQDRRGVVPSSQRPGVLCATATAGHKPVVADPMLGEGGGIAEDGGVRGGISNPRRLKVQLAVDTDYEYYTLFNDTTAAATYIAMMYARVGEIFLREINVSIELTFVRIWDTPTDPFDAPQGSLLGSFQSYWQVNMGSVTRDCAQLCSGRRDLGYGGIAYLNAVCNGSSYSVIGYVLGYYPDLSTPNSENYDVMVAAHELGHNFGTLHTHDYGIDNCQSIDTPARRGSIMSYCSQTVSGGHAVIDLYFEYTLRANMRSYLRNRPCLDRDCNGNNVADAVDISGGVSTDVNLNGVPDECEDCNANGQFDNIDIAAGFSDDVDNNAVPDECQPDCNGNGVPDLWEISQNPPIDRHRDGVPDECQADCDANGEADYNQIQADMTLDVDRDRVLDNCQDCDADGVNDLFALDGSRNLWITSSEHPEVMEFYATTGVRFRDATAPGMVAGQDVLVTSDRRVLVSSGEDDRIVEFDRTGAFVRTLVQGGKGESLEFPAAMTLTSEGTLLVVSRGTSSVLEYDVVSGSLIRTLVAPGAGGLVEPFALTIVPPPGGGPGGDLLVSSDDNSVRRYDATTGAYIDTPVPAGHGGLDTPRGLLVKPDGRLLVSSHGSSQVLEYNLQTGEALGQWNRNGTDSVLRLLSPWDIIFGHDGNVYVAVNDNHGPEGFDPPPFFRDPRLHVTNTKVFRFDVRNGNFLTSFVIGQDTGLEHPAGLAFMPLDGDLDCNANQFPDSCEIAQGLADDCNANARPDSCDLASGVDTDYNANGVLDSCECLADWNNDGIVNSVDVGQFINSWFEDQLGGPIETDFNNDGVSNSTDVSDFINAYFAGVGSCG